MIRHRARLDWWIKQTAVPLEPTPRTRVIADLVLRDGLNESDIAGLFGSTDYAPPLLAPEESALIGNLEGQDINQPTQPAWVRHEFPDWLETPLTELFGDRLEQEMAAHNEPATVDLRVNTFKTSRAKVQALLQEAGVACEPTSLSPLGLRLRDHPRVTQSPLYKDGLFEVQDEGSQMAALLTDARPGMTVIDFCAGAGGKTLALSNAMVVKGRFNGALWACDIAEPRLQELQKRADRNGAADTILTHVLLENDFWIADNANLADRVLADVPCSGTGTWRREPEARWRLTPEALQDYVSRQQNILSQAARLVKSGGRLVYVTCSILPAENEEQIAWFLENHPAFKAIPVQGTWKTIPSSSGPALRLSPATSGTDGFFIAILQRD